MNFFKKLGKTATDIWASTVYKVGSVRKISKINATLAKEESNIDALYLEIGKAYFDAHLADTDCEFSDKVLAIKEAKQKIEDGEKQKLNLRKVQRGEKCGAEMPDILLFCTACGNKMPVVEEHDICAHCATYVPKGMRFCTECGKPMPGTIAEEKKAIKACPSCGAKLKKKNAFCTECGTKIN
jgi:predicted amidophosphoribosyltransferase